jgi:UDP-glucuronate 4-epimerase
MQVVAPLEQELGRQVHKELMSMQPGDVPTTYADIDDLIRDIDFRPATSIEVGIPKFTAWYRDFYHA